MFAGDGSGDRHPGATRELGHSRPTHVGVRHWRDYGRRAAGRVARNGPPRAALTGVAPYDEERGAMRSKPVIASFAARFTAGGKPVRVRVIACLRKLLTILNAMLAKDEVWTPQRQTP